MLGSSSTTRTRTGWSVSVAMDRSLAIEAGRFLSACCELRGSRFPSAGSMGAESCPCAAPAACRASCAAGIPEPALRGRASQRHALAVVEPAHARGLALGLDRGHDLARPDASVLAARAAHPAAVGHDPADLAAAGRLCQPGDAHFALAAGEAAEACHVRARLDNRA